MKKTKLYLYFKIALFLLIFACKSSNNHDNLIQDRLVSLLENSLQNECSFVFEIDTITNFEWDKFIIILPYTRLNALGKELKVDLNELVHTGIESSDNYYLLVFLKNDSIIKYSYYYRYPCDFYYLDGNRIFTKQNSKFTIIKTNQNTLGGKSIYHLKNINI